MSVIMPDETELILLARTVQTAQAEETLTCYSDSRCFNDYDSSSSNSSSSSSSKREREQQRKRTIPIISQKPKQKKKKPPQRQHRPRFIEEKSSAMAEAAAALQDAVRGPGIASIPVEFAECLVPGRINIMTKDVIMNLFYCTVETHAGGRYQPLGKGAYASSYTDAQDPSVVLAERVIPWGQEHVIRLYGKMFEKRLFEREGTNVLFPHSLVLGVPNELKRDLRRMMHPERIQEIVRAAQVKQTLMTYEVTARMDCNFATFTESAVPKMSQEERGALWREGMESLVNGLDFLHTEVGVAHGDLHPGNVLVRWNAPPGQRLYIIDFDLSYFIDARPQIGSFQLLCFAGCRLPSTVIINQGRPDFTVVAPRSFDYYAVIVFMLTRVFGRKIEDFFIEAFDVEERFYGSLKRHCQCAWPEHEREVCSFPLAVLMSRMISANGPTTVLRMILKWASAVRPVFSTEARANNMLKHMAWTLERALIYGSNPAFSGGRHVKTDRADGSVFYLSQLGAPADPGNPGPSASGLNRVANRMAAKAAAAVIKSSQKVANMLKMPGPYVETPILRPIVRASAAAAAPPPRPLIINTNPAADTNLTGTVYLPYV